MNSIQICPNVYTQFIVSVFTFLFSFFNHMTFFLACLVIHERRIDDAKHCCTCQRIESRSVAMETGRSSCCFLCCCTGQRPTSPEDTECILIKFPKHLFSKASLTTPLKVISLVILTGLTAVSCWQLCGTKADVFHENVISKRSYFYEYNKVNEQHFTKGTYVTYFTDNVQTPYSDTLERTLKDLNTYIRGNPYGLSNQAIFWFQEYKNSSFYNNTSDLTFVQGLNNFFALNKDYIDDITFSGDKIESYRFYVQATTQDSTVTFARLRQSLGTSVSFGGQSLNIYSPDFLYTDSYKQSLWEFLIFICIQCFVFVVFTALFCKNFQIVIHICIWYILMCICLLGFTNIFCEYITSVVSAVLRLGITFGLQIIIFMYFAFYAADGTDSGARTYYVLCTVTPSFFNVLFASAVGQLMLLLTTSYVFNVVFKVFMTGIIFSLLLVCTFIPTATSLLGPAKQEHSPDNSIQELRTPSQSLAMTGYVNEGFKKQTE